MLAASPYCFVFGVCVVLVLGAIDDPGAVPTRTLGSSTERQAISLAVADAKASCASKSRGWRTAAASPSLFRTRPNQVDAHTL